jgi:hypothetical protein
MNRYKFYSLRDECKEAIHIFDAPNIEEAYMIASQIKQLHIKEFKKIFDVGEKVKS